MNKGILIGFGAVLAAAINVYAGVGIPEQRAEAFIATADEVVKAELSGGTEAGGSEPVPVPYVEEGGSAAGAESKVWKYNMLKEEEYTEEHWKEFYQHFPEYTDASGSGMKADITSFFIPYYSMGMTDYEEGNVFGGWELTTDDGTGENVISHGVYAYGRVGNETGQRWHRFNEQETSSYYPYFYHHVVSAEVVNGNTLRINVDVDVEDQTGGEPGRCTYQLSPNYDYNGYTGGLKNTWLEIRDRVSASRGQLTTHYFESKVSSSRTGKRLRFKGYIDYTGAEITDFKNAMYKADHLAWGAGLINSTCYSMKTGGVYCPNLNNSVNMASCSHPGKRYEQIAGNETEHNVFCSGCGMHMGREAHGAADEFSKCSLCQYQLNVSGMAVCEFNGYTKEIPYSMKPGQIYQPEQVKGYHQPQGVAIPEKGGNINIKYQPVSYRLTADKLNKTLLYDESYIMEVIPRKGMQHIGYVVEAV